MPGRRGLRDGKALADRVLSSSPTSFVIADIIIFLLRRAEVIPEDVPADLPPLAGARLLVEAEVDPAVDPGVVDVVGDLPPGGVVEDDARQTGIGQGDG